MSAFCTSQRSAALCFNHPSRYEKHMFPLETGGESVMRDSAGYYSVEPHVTWAPIDTHCHYPPSSLGNASKLAHVPLPISHEQSLSHSRYSALTASLYDYPATTTAHVAVSYPDLYDDIDAHHPVHRGRSSQRRLPTNVSVASLVTDTPEPTPQGLQLLALAHRVFLSWLLRTLRARVVHDIHAHIYVAACTSLARRYLNAWMRTAHARKQCRSSCHQQQRQQQLRHAEQLCSRNARRMVRLFFVTWRHRRHCTYQLEQVRAMNERANVRLALRAMLLWRCFALESCLVSALETRAATCVAVQYFRMWSQRATARVHQQRLQRQVLCGVAHRYFGRWQLWLVRQLKALCLERENWARMIRPVMTRWVWATELRRLAYRRWVTKHGLPFPH